MALMKYIRACALCKMYFPPTDWLCSLCWKAVQREYLCSESSYRIEKTLPHLRLLDWHKDNHQLIQLLINSLKQGGPHFIFKRLGLEMFSRFLYLNLWNKKTFPLFIPAPSRLKSKTDHALQLAESLSFYFGGDVKNLLKRGKALGFQKKKTKRQRADIQIQSQGNIPPLRPIVFVDDVLTTGSTARAAFQALNQPKHFFIFTLAWKRPMTGFIASDFSLIQKKNKLL